MNLQKYLYYVLVDRLYKENSNKNRNNLYPYKSIGKVIYDPCKKGKFDPNWVILECDEEIKNYYTWFLTKKGIKLSGSVWGSHVSIIRGKWDYIDPKLLEQYWKYNEGQMLEFEYGDLVTNGDHWWLEARSKELEKMRLKFGLNISPGRGFHLTIGKILK